MKKVLFALAMVAFVALPAMAEEKLSDERLVDLVAGPEVTKVEIKVIPASDDDKTDMPYVIIKAEGAPRLFTPLPTRDYEVRVVKSKRGVIFTHKDSKEHVVLVRTRYTDEKDEQWAVAYVSKQAQEGGRYSVTFTTLEDFDTRRFGILLAHIVP